MLKCMRRSVDKGGQEGLIQWKCLFSPTSENEAVAAILDFPNNGSHSIFTVWARNLVYIGFWCLRIQWKVFLYFLYLLFMHMDLLFCNLTCVSQFCAHKYRCVFMRCGGIVGETRSAVSSY